MYSQKEALVDQVQHMHAVQQENDRLHSINQQLRAELNDFDKSSLQHATQFSQQDQVIKDLRSQLAQERKKSGFYKDEY